MKIAELISKELKEKAGWKPLKQGEKRVYQLLAKPDPKGGILCPPLKEVTNSYVIYDGGVSKTINYFIRQRPAPAESNRDYIPEYGYLNFTREQGGKIVVSGDENKDLFLFFHPYNQSTQGLPGYQKPRTGYVFETVNAEKKADDTIQINRRRRNAETIIDEAPDADVKLMAEDIFEQSMEGVSDTLIRAKLISFVQKPDNALKFMALNKDEKMMVKKVVNAAKTKGVIKQIAHDQFVWADSGENLVTKKPGKTLMDSAVFYFLSAEGHEVLKTLNSIVSEKEESLKS